MKKVAIASCYFQYNYGSQLQAYATQKILDDWGVENETICIDGLKKEINYAKYKYFLRMILDTATVKGKWGSIKHAFRLHLNKSFGNNVAVRNEKFKIFATEMFNLSPRYNSKAELTDQCNQYSAVIVGSDQLWLPSNIEANYYTLNFVPTAIPKIAYATSFGIANMPQRQKGKATAFLNRIEFLSVREKSGQEIIKTLTNKDVPLVCDPTLLFSAEEWMTIQKEERVINEKYIFCYFLGNNPIQREFANRLKKFTGLKIVQLRHMDEFIKTDESFADYAPYDIGPAEYVSLIRDAEFVCTDSFHGSVFSILHKKRFFSFKRYRKDSSVSTNSRLYSLLSLLKLNDRFLTGNEDIANCLNRKINYESVFCQLDEFRTLSKKFLKNALI